MNRFFLALAMILFLNACKSDDEGQPVIDLTGKFVIPATTRDTVLFATSVDNVSIPIFISIPSAATNLAGTVMMHGSGGNWDDSDTNNDGIDDTIEEWELSSQNEQWKSMLDNEGIVSAFPGSYYRRGTVENAGDWKNPPLQFEISASFIRNYDAYKTLEVLKNLVREDGTAIVTPDNVAIVGFSHGATAVQSTLFDTSVVPVNWEWSQSYSGTLYTNEIRVPASLPADGGFRAGIMYYPGSFHNSYYGNPCSGTSIFQTYTDFMIHVPSEDSLTPNTNCMLETVGNNGGGTATIHRYEGANHGFDNSSSGIDGGSNALARTRSINYLKLKLGLN
ncbi:dienelactone hydrolase family protein [Roseivirga sp.]|uniref:dienelactone hydrolase family protein n=1 Tax=Roseivirga sp. TaxID=1964215 RepID=UPI003B8C5A40